MSRSHEHSKVSHTPGAIEEEAKSLREELVPLSPDAWIAQAEALRAAASAAAEYRSAINDLEISLDAIGGQVNRFASALGNLTAVQRKLVREQKELKLEVENFKQKGEDSTAVPRPEEKKVSAPTAKIAPPRTTLPSPLESNLPVKGLDMFGQAEAIVASGSATPQQQQFLANLASVMSAHSLTYQQAIEYFKLNENNLQTVMNILEQHKTAIANFAARLDSLGH
jgi:tetratricopeptide (TPR) repeat protein